MRRGRRLGIDVGDARIGTAVSDPSGMLATPLETVAAGDGALARLVELSTEHEVIEIVVGLPRSLSGREGPAARKVREFAAALREVTAAVPVRLYDERLSTVQADRALRGRRKGAAKRAVIDQVAATVILQAALDAERANGVEPGTVV